MKGIDVIVEQAGSRYQIAVVRVLGQIDTTTSHELERRLQYLLRDRQFEIIIDLSKVTYISSAGWGIFISEIRGIRESGGDLKLVGMTPEVSEVFELLEFHNILESFKTVETAVERFERPKTPTAQEKHKSDESNKGSEPVTQGDAIHDTRAVTQGDAIHGVGPHATPAVDQDAVSQTTSGIDESGKSETSGANTSQTTKENAPAKLTAARATTSRIDNEYAAGNRSRAGIANETFPETARQTAEPQTKPLSKDLEAMILEIVREHPDYGALKVRKELLEHDYRRPINPLTLFMELKRLNLETKEKRKRYADSFAVVGSKK